MHYHSPNPLHSLHLLSNIIHSNHIKHLVPNCHNYHNQYIIILIRLQVVHPHNCHHHHHLPVYVQYYPQPPPPSNHSTQLSNQCGIIPSHHLHMYDLPKLFTIIHNNLLLVCHFITSSHQLILTPYYPYNSQINIIIVTFLLCSESNPIITNVV